MTYDEPVLFARLQPRDVVASWEMLHCWFWPADCE